MMTPAQLRRYRATWNDVRKVLRAKGMTPTEADAERHAIHRRTLGHDKSSNKFTNAELTKVLLAFGAVLRPPQDLDEQLASDNPRTLRRSVLLLCAALGETEDYLDGMVRQMNLGGRIGQPLAENRAANFDYAHTIGGQPARPGLMFADLGDAELLKLQYALKIQCRRVWATKEILLWALDDAGKDLDPDMTGEAAREALGWSSLPDMTRMKYDHLVLCLGAIRPLAGVESPF